MTAPATRIRTGRGPDWAAAVACLAAVLLVALLAAPPPVARAQSTPVAHAVLFYSPTCAHCRELIRAGLPPILTRYGEQLQLLAVDAAAQPGTGLFASAVGRYDVPPAERGVPAVVIGDRFLAGTTDITEQLPILVAQHLKSGGVGWPAVPGLARLASEPGSVVTSSPGGLIAATEPPTGILDRLARDRWGNTAALIILAAMAAAAGLVLARLVGRRRVLTAPPVEGALPDRLLPISLLLAAGLSVAGYLTYTAATGSRVLCGPSGSCDIVQNSSYARLFGVVPVAYVGLAGYLLIAVAFVVSIVATGPTARAARFTTLGLTLAGVLFSLYLTVLEPFVLGATCLWCLASAGIMTALLLLSAQRVGLVGPALKGRPVGDPAAGDPAMGSRGRSQAGSQAG